MDSFMSLTQEIVNTLKLMRFHNVSLWFVVQTTLWTYVSFTIFWFFVRTLGGGGGDD